MTDSQPLNIGLLLCDDVPADGRKRFGDYFGMFSRGIKAADDNISLTPYDAYKGQLPDLPATHDGYLISGSAASVFDEEQWIGDLMEFVRQCYQQRVKTVGICFGHQLIAHALGGETIRSNNGWGFGIHQAKINQYPNWMEAEDRDYKLVVIHQDQVVSLPERFSTVASNDFCPHSMITDNDTMLGIQGHPEFSKEYCAYRADFRRQKIGEDKHSECMELLANNNPDSTEVLSWVSQFFRH